VKADLLAGQHFAKRLALLGEFPFGTFFFLTGVFEQTTIEFGSFLTRALDHQMRLSLAGRRKHSG
jgi:hypothetical protein